MSLVSSFGTNAARRELASPLGRSVPFGVTTGAAGAGGVVAAGVALATIRTPGCASPEAAWASTAGFDPVFGTVTAAPVPTGRCVFALRRLFRPPAALASLK